MLTLYYKPTCSYCQRVLGEAEDLGISFNLKDISNDPVLVEELINAGGKRQVPFLFDAEKSIALYESNDIIDYLKENCANESNKQSFSGLRIHKSDEACDTCQ
jgi:glutaredoxin 3